MTIMSFSGPAATVVEAHERLASIARDDAWLTARLRIEALISRHPQFPALVRAVAGAEAPDRYYRLRRTWYPWLVSAGEYRMVAPRFTYDSDSIARHRSIKARSYRLAERIADSLVAEHGVDERCEPEAQAWVLAREFVRAREDAHPLPFPVDPAYPDESLVAVV